MKSYGQFCALARALDHVGDRWTLLIVRELLISPAGYAALVRSLPGIPTNLLAARLRQLEADGIVRRVIPQGGARGVHHELTELGRGLEPGVLAMVRWGARWMGAGRGGDRFDPRWLVLALRALLAGPSGAGPPAEVELRPAGGVLTVTADPAGRWVRPGAGTAPVATVTGDPAQLLSVASGMLSLDQADRLEVTGDRAAAHRVLRAGSAPGAHEGADIS